MALMRIMVTAVGQVVHCQVPNFIYSKVMKMLGSFMLPSVIMTVSCRQLLLPRKTTMVKMMPTPMMIKSLCLCCQNPDRR